MTRRIFTALVLACGLASGSLAVPATGLARTHHGARHHHRHSLHRRQGPLAHIALL